jgi:Zn-dependent M28 family amino/carboxypeptidase
VLPGETDRRIYVGAHYDAVKEGEGIIDNWTAASLLPTLYWSLKDKPGKHTFVFASFADEERGLLGSRSHVKRLGKEQVGRISAMVNIDTLGCRWTGLASIRSATPIPRRSTSAGSPPSPSIR